MSWKRKTIGKIVKVTGAKLSWCQKLILQCKCHIYINLLCTDSIPLHSTHESHVCFGSMPESYYIDSTESIELWRVKLPDKYCTTTWTWTCATDNYFSFAITTKCNNIIMINNDDQDRHRDNCEDHTPPQKCWITSCRGLSCNDSLSSMLIKTDAETTY